VRQHPVTTDRGSSFRLAAIIVRCGSLLGPGPFARPGSREVSVGFPFARFGRPHSWRIACSDSNGKCPAGLLARPAVFTTDGADADPPRAVSPTVLEELWSKRDRRLMSPVALRARITGSSRLTAAAGRASPCGGSRPAGLPARPDPPTNRPGRDDLSTDQDI
jgi:hypothetical protein